MTTSKPIKPVKLAGAVLRRSPEPSAARTATKAPPPGPQLALTLENPGDKPMHVWATARAIDYDASSGVLTLYLTEHTPAPPPGITLISKHPRPPSQVVVAGHGKTTFEVALPQSIRRRVGGAGLGMHFVEEPIGAVSRVALHVQYASEAIEPKKDEAPDTFAERLRRHGSVELTSIAASKE